jgi:hypothetical protein
VPGHVPARPERCWSRSGSAPSRFVRPSSSAWATLGRPRSATRRSRPPPILIGRGRFPTRWVARSGITADAVRQRVMDATEDAGPPEAPPLKPPPPAEADPAHALDLAPSPLGHDPRRRRPWGSASTPPTNPAPEPSPLGNLIQRAGRVRWLCRFLLVLSRHATVSAVPRVQGPGRPPGQAVQEGRVMFPRRTPAPPGLRRSGKSLGSTPRCCALRASESSRRPEKDREGNVFSLERLSSPARVGCEPAGCSILDD